MNFTSYAQNFEDVLLWRALGAVRDGFYVDVGAWDPDHDSVTRAFSERGWHGINIDPSSTAAEALRHRRPRDVNLELAVGAEPGELTFFEIPGTGLSTTDPDLAASHRRAGHTIHERRVPMQTLAAICDAHAPGPIHFLKVDCEGAEPAALAGADLARIRPWIILVEATAPNSQVPTHEAWEPLVLAAGYAFAWFDGLNRFYVAEEHAPTLLPKLQLPPNVFDAFVRAPLPPLPHPAPPPPDDALLATPATLGTDARIALAQSCRDADPIPKVPGAGTVQTEPDGTRVQLMHNGLKVLADGYCGPWMTQLIALCHGHHEPQEERLFHEATRCLPPDATMIELGGNWSYYSAWFLQGAPSRRAVILEPDSANRAVGEATMRLNGLEAAFVAGVAAAQDGEPAPFETERSGALALPRWSVPGLMAAHALDRLDLLHCDAQGAELAVLQGCEAAFRDGRIGLVFVSTHAHPITGDPLTHQRCLALLRACGAVIEAEHDAQESFSGDGLIVARFGPRLPGWPTVPITHARHGHTLFRDTAFDLAEARRDLHAQQAFMEQVVADVFDALLFRVVDRPGLAAFVAHLRTTGSAAGLLSIVLRSPEFVSKRRQFGIAYLQEAGEPSAPRLPTMPPAGPFACAALDLVLERDTPLGQPGDHLVMTNDEVMLPAILAAGAWSPHHTDFIAEHADPARHYLLLDIGANAGLFTRQAALRCPNIAECVCIEPDAANYAALVRNLAPLRPTIRTFNLALGEADGPATFFRDAGNSGNYSLHIDAVRDRPHDAVQVPVAAAGPFLARELQGDAPILWKSDTQGCDEAIIAATRWPVWRRVQAAIVELWRIRKGAPVPDAFFEKLADFPNLRLGASPTTIPAIRAYLASDDYQHDDLFLWR